MTDSIQFSVIRTLDALKELEHEWDDLLDKIPDRFVFQTFQWHYNVTKAFNRQSEMLVFAFRKGATLIGLLPFRIISRNFKIKRYKAIEFLTHNRADYQDMILNEYKNECLLLFCEFLKKNKRLWDVLFLRYIPAKSDNSNLLSEMLNKNGNETKIEKGIVCPVININETFEGYTAKRKKKLLNDIRRCERRLREIGDLDIFRYSGETSIESITDAFIQQHRKRWNLTGTPSKFNKGEHCEYYKILFESLYQDGNLDLYCLKLDEKIIGFHFGTKYNNKIFFYTPTFDPDYSKYSPSKILLMHIIENCFRNNVSCFDFLAGAEQYKYDWTKMENQTTIFLAFRNKFAGLIYNVFFNPDSYKIFKRFKTTI